jgi:EF hand
MDSSEREPTPPRSQKLNRIKHQPLPTTLPPRTGVPSRKKQKRWIPLGYGVVAATALVVVAAVIGAFVFGSGNTSHVAAVDQHQTRDADLASREGDAVESASGHPQSVSSPDQPPTPISPSTTSAKPQASQGQAPASRHHTDPTASPAAAKASASAGAAVRSDTARSASAPRPSTDNSDSSEKEPGPVVFDGGPKRGTTIEQYFRKLDTNHDGRLDATELPLHIINRADTTKDGELTLSELKKAFKKLGQKLFAPPMPAETRRLPRGTGPRNDGATPGQRNGGL